MELLRSLVLGWLLGVEDVRESFRRSALGPIWISLTLALQVTVISLIFTVVLGHPLDEYVPYLAIGLSTWHFIQNSLVESGFALIQSRELVLEFNVSRISLAIRVVAKNLIFFGFHSALIWISLLVFGFGIGAEIFLFVLGVGTVALSISWVAVLLSFANARFRDIAPILQSLLTVSFYATPIIWVEGSFVDLGLERLLQLNPFALYIGLVREPLLANEFPFFQFMIASASALLGWAIAVQIDKKFRYQSVFWV